MSELTMSKATREAFLADVHVGVFCVTRPAQRRSPAPVWYLYEPGGDVRVIVGKESQKAELVRAAGVASLCAQSESIPYRFVTVEGPAVLEGGAGDIRFAIAERYLGSELAKTYVEQTSGFDGARGADHAGTLADPGLLELERVAGMPTIGLVGVGAMGARVGGALVTGGARVVSVLSDRTPGHGTEPSERASPTSPTSAPLSPRARSSCRSCRPASRPQSRARSSSRRRARPIRTPSSSIATRSHRAVVARSPVSSRPAA